MPSNNQTRARIRRASNTTGTEQHQDALAIATDALAAGMEKIAEKAKNGDPDAMAIIIKLTQEEFSRARSGANDPLLIRLREIREAGSPMLMQLWTTLYRNIPEAQMEVTTSL